jgi:hypothetical protein
LTLGIACAMDLMRKPVVAIFPDGRTKMRNDQADPMQTAVIRVRLSQKAEYCIRAHSCCESLDAAPLWTSRAHGANRSAVLLSARH